MPGLAGIHSSAHAPVAEHAPQFALLGAQHGHLLSKQSGGEEDAAENHRGLNDRPDGTHGKPAVTGEEKPDSGHPSDNPDCEQRGTEHSESQQWLLGELELEPDR